MSELKSETPAYASKYSVDYLERRVSRLSKMIRLIASHLVDKKLIGSELAKTIQETLAEETDKNFLDWFLSQTEE